MDKLSDRELDTLISELRAEIRLRRDGLDPSTPNGRDYPDGSSGPLYALHMREWQEVTARLERDYQAAGAERMRRRGLVCWTRSPSGFGPCQLSAGHAEAHSATITGATGRSQTQVWRDAVVTSSVRTTI